MAVHIEQTFTVAAPIDRVWAFLTDPYQVVACLPGAAITSKVDDQTYEGTVSVKVGPITAAYKGQVRFERLDQEHWEAEAVGRGQDIRGKGGAEMRMVSRLAALPGDQTQVTVTSDVNISGILAQMGRGMIENVSGQIFQQFAAAVRKKLEDGTNAGAGGTADGKPVDALSLGAKAVGDSVRRLFGDKGAG